MKFKFKWWHGALFFVFLLIIFSPLASSSPDGLESVAENKGFIDSAIAPVLTILPDYAIPGVRNEAVGTILAGIAGTLILFGIGYGLSRLLKTKKNEA